ncbi:MAG: hypothetical protein CL569_10515 [Alphaproteobacteria bacterium]|nr:hypothetical protein [Alphaproteobacteria bacterium]|tara:strand:- start:1968 stop:2804 length:837 start_codon:yes stop_codon:yes gene_type:complete
MLGVLLALALWLQPMGARAAASSWVTTEFSQLRLISAQDFISGRQSLSFGIQIRLEAGWKTYWRNPGDAGIPTFFDWSASQNVEDVALAWPAPKRIPFEGLDSFGYEEEVIFPALVRLVDPSSPVRIDVKVAYAVCKHICVPLEAHVTLELLAVGTAQETATTAHRSLIQRFESRVPDRNGTQLDIIEARVGGRTGRQVLHLTVGAEESFHHPDVFVEGPADVIFGRPKVALAEDRRRAVVGIPIDEAEDVTYGYEPLTITLVDGDRSIEREVTPPRN